MSTVESLTTAQIRAEIAASAAGIKPFGGALLARGMTPVINQVGTGPYATQMDASGWVFSNPWEFSGATTDFQLEVSPDDPNQFGTNLSGWYSIRYQANLGFSEAEYPPSVRLQGCGYYGDNYEGSFACAKYGADPVVGVDGVEIDVTQSAIWMPAMGTDGDDTGYFYAQFRWMDLEQRDLLDVYPVNMYVSLLKATGD